MPHFSKLVALFAAIAAATLLAACGATAESEGDVKSSAPEPAVVESSAGAVATESDGEGAAEDAADSETGAQESGDAKPTPRSERISTDPSTVALAAGKPQMVEFFAYW